jgi:hypothetical protein
MKVLKWTLGIVLGLVVCFFMIGVVKPEINYTTSIAVNSTAKEAFRVYNDVSKMAKWLEGFKGITLIKGLPYHTESEYEVIMEVDGKLMKMKETIIAIERNALFAYLLENEMLWCETEVYFKEENGHTEITAVNRVKGKSALWRSLFVLFQKDFEQKATQTYTRLKATIETK